jgi:glucokinase
MLLVGDIGGTKTDLALFSAERGPRAPIAQKRFGSGAYPSLEAIVGEESALLGAAATAFDAIAQSATQPAGSVTA